MSFNPNTLGGGFPGISAKVVHDENASSERSMDRQKLRTSFSSFLSSNSVTPFQRVENMEGFNTYVKDSSNYVTFKKLRAINKNYNDKAH